MIIKKITLKNIRSYTETSLDFPQGSILLSGDIGSGKSTILYAIEFALFGLIRGSLQGETLLRKGAKEGLVKLEFTCNNINYKIQRALKLVGDKVQQIPGFIEQEGVRKEATAIEIKSKVLEILNYPSGLLNKKSLIYRYAVYTPQDDMKKILFDTKEERLDTLRKIFNIDKYKIIKQNLTTYLKNLRDKKNIYEGETRDIQEKKNQLKEINEDIEKVKQDLSLLHPQKELASSNVKSWNEKLTKIQKDIELQTKNKHDLELNRMKAEELSKQIVRFESEEERLTKELTDCKIKIDQLKLGAQPNEDIIMAILEKIKEVEGKLIEIISETKQHELQILNHNKEIAQITDLDNCPLCKQIVKNNHKELIINKHQNHIKDLNEKIKEHTTKKEKINTILEELKGKKEMYSNLIQDYKIKKNNLDNLTLMLDKYKQQLDNNRQLITKTKDVLKLLNRQYMELTEIKIDDSLTTKSKEIKQQLENSQQILQKIEIEIARNEQTIKQNQLFEEKLKQEIIKKEKLVKKIEQIKKYQNWLQNYFIPLQDLLEKSVFTQIHNKFSGVFQEWFRELIDDENIDVRLDDEFTPLCIQNGHDIEIKDLSGGEKTAIALAYRLALNNVINDFFLNMNTKDIIMLDEPTDGFSSSQLDKMREVLEQLNLKQILIVSHENKIESFVDNVIKIHKNNHISELH